MEIETNNFKMWAEFAGALMGAKRPGGATTGIENRKPTALDLKTMGMSRKKR